MKDLLEAGVHFGHQTKRWNPKMKEYIFGERNGIYILDLGKTVKLFKEAEEFVQKLAADGIVAHADLDKAELAVNLRSREVAAAEFEVHVAEHRLDHHGGDILAAAGGFLAVHAGKPLVAQRRLAQFLDDAGHVIAARLEASSGHPILDEAAVRAARTLHDLPAGAPREALLPVRFRLR